MEIILKDEVKIDGFKDSYQFFMMAKANNRAFYISFGDAADQTIADYILKELVYKPTKNYVSHYGDITLVLEPLSQTDFLALIEIKDELRVEFFYEGRVHYFDVKVDLVNSCEFGSGISTKLPNNISVKKVTRNVLTYSC